MISGVLYSESGGTFKTTFTSNIAVALERMGLNTLMVDLDAQKGNLSNLTETGHDQKDPQADNLAKHILGSSDGDFYDLIETTPEGVDIIPSHDMFGNFTATLEQKIDYETEMKDMNREDYPRYELMYELFWNEHELQNEYDAILVDPNARAEDLLYNAIYALRTLIAPVKPAGKGMLSLEGLGEMTGNMEQHLGINIGLSCVIPNNVNSQNNTHTLYTQEFQDTAEFAIPVAIRQRESMMNAMWEANGSAFKVIEERWKMPSESNDLTEPQPGERRIRDSEIMTLKKLTKLAWFIATETFDADVDPILELDIDDYGTRTIDLREDPIEEELTA